MKSHSNLTVFYMLILEHVCSDIKLMQCPFGRYLRVNCALLAWIADSNL